METQKIKSFTGLRFIMIMVIFVSHFEFLAKSEPLNVSESDELSFKFEHEAIAINIKQVESNPNNFFIVFSAEAAH